VADERPKMPEVSVLSWGASDEARMRQAWLDYAHELELWRARNPDKIPVDPRTDPVTAGEYALIAAGVIAGTVAAMNPVLAAGGGLIVTGGSVGSVAAEVGVVGAAGAFFDSDPARRRLAEYDAEQAAYNATHGSLGGRNPQAVAPEDRQVAADTAELTDIQRWRKMGEYTQTYNATHNPMGGFNSPEDEAAWHSFYGAMFPARSGGGGVGGGGSHKAGGAGMTADEFIAWSDRKAQATPVGVAAPVAPGDKFLSQQPGEDLGAWQERIFGYAAPETWAESRAVNDAKDAVSAAVARSLGPYVKGPGWASQDSTDLGGQDALRQIMAGMYNSLVPDSPAYNADVLARMSPTQRALMSSVDRWGNQVDPANLDSVLGTGRGGYPGQRGDTRDQRNSVADLFGSISGGGGSGGGGGADAADVGEGLLSVPGFISSFWAHDAQIPKEFKFGGGQTGGTYTNPGGGYQPTVPAGGVGLGDVPGILSVATLGVVPLATHLLGLFGVGSVNPDVLSYASPETIGFRAEAGAGGTVNVTNGPQRTPDQWFQDHASQIGQAARNALLNNSTLGDVINDL
jgi:hypothetical protein